MSSEKGKVGLLNESVEESERASVAIEFNTQKNSQGFISARTLLLGSDEEHKI